MTKKLILLVLPIVAILIVGLLYAEDGPVAGELTPPVPSAEKSTDIEILRQIYSEFIEPTAHNSCAFDFVTTTIFWDAEGELDTTIVPMYYAANSKRMQLVSDSLSMYSDDSLMVVVVPTSRSIFISSLHDLNYKVVRKQMMGLALHSLFDEGRVLESGISNSGSADEAASPHRRLVFVPGYELQSRIGARRVSIVFDREQRTLVSVTVDFATSQRTLSTRIDYGEFKWDEVPEEFLAPLISVIQDETGSIKPQYAKFDIDDRR